MSLGGEVSCMNWGFRGWGDLRGVGHTVDFVLLSTENGGKVIGHGCCW